MSTNEEFGNWFNKDKKPLNYILAIDRSCPGIRSYTQTVVIPPVNDIGEINHHPRIEPNWILIDDVGQDSYNHMVEHVLTEEEESISLQISLAI